MHAVQLFAVTQTGPLPLPVSPGALTIHDLFDDLPIGVYSALCTFEHIKFLHLEDHLNRLERSMPLLGWDYELDRLSMRQSLHQVCLAYPLPNARIRIDILAKPPANFDTTSRVLIALSPFEPSPDILYEQGVRVSFTQQLSRDLPLVKQADFVYQRRHYLDDNPDLYECLMVDQDGRILEGTTSNFYAVHDGVLYTAGSGVLEGIARKIVLKVAHDIGIPIRMEAVRMDDIPRLDEAGLSSSSRALIPIIQIGDQIVGNGRPGPVAKRILAAYNSYVDRELRPAIEI